MLIKRKNPKKTKRKFNPPNLERFVASVDAAKYPRHVGMPKPKYIPTSVEKSIRVGKVEMSMPTGINDKAAPASIQ
jgi:hypothetical protein